MQVSRQSPAHGHDFVFNIKCHIFAPASLQGRVKFPTGGKVREPSCVVRQSFQVLRAADEAEPLKLRYRQYAEQSADSLDGRRIIYAFYAICYTLFLCLELYAESDNLRFFLCVNL